MPVSNVLEQEARKAKIRAKGRAKGSSPKLLMSPVREKIFASKVVPKASHISHHQFERVETESSVSLVSATSGPSSQKVLQRKSKKSAKPCILVKTNWWLGVDESPKLQVEQNEK